MRVYTYGNKFNDKIILLHPLMSDANFFKRIIEKLRDKYFLIVPTLSGHYEGSTFVSTQDEELQLTQHLRRSGITHVKMIIGFSLGGNIALDYFCRNSDKIDKLIVDSAPLFNLQPLARRAFFKKYKSRVRYEQGKQQTLEEDNERAAFFQTAAKYITDKSLQNLVKSCYKVRLPKASKDAQKRMTFIYGTKDKARGCLKRLRLYREGTFYTLDDYKHCELFLTQPDAYIDKFIEKEKTEPKLLYH
ncbi:MAG: alpha/beta hydrolase [Corallococcus sp.]|nr:alpha/beta hydrolase [Corallococcus sp.]